MINIKVCNAGLLLIAFIAGSPIYAQPPGGPVVNSPQVRADNTVVFSFLSKTAKEVKVTTQFEKSPALMTKDSIGIWTVTLGPVKPDIYPYNFIVDGTPVADPDFPAATFIR